MLDRVATLTGPFFKGGVQTATTVAGMSTRVFTVVQTARQALATCLQANVLVVVATNVVAFVPTTQHLLLTLLRTLPLTNF